MPKAYDVKARKMVEIMNPKEVQKVTRKGRKITMIAGTSPLTGIKVFRIVGNTSA